MPSLKTDTTELLFWEDPYTTEFKAKIIEITEKGLVLDKTVFYPIGGGQHADNGTLQKASDKKTIFQVTSVEKIDGKIVHILKKNDLKKLKIADIIVGKINWERRYNLMKAHTSQHVLSAIIVKQSNIETSKAIIDENEVSIYLEKKISEEDLIKVLVETNTILNSDNKIITKTITKKELPKSLEKHLRGHLEEITADKIRIVSVKGVDDSLCGGTHCNNTNEIGSIALGDFKGDVITYTFGTEAIKLNAKYSIGAIRTAKKLAAKPSEVFDRLEKTLDDYNEQKELNYKLVKMAVNSQMSELKKNPLKIGEFLVFLYDFSYAEKKHVLQELGELDDNSIGVFLIRGPILLITSNNNKLPANEIIKAFSQQSNNKGGGSPTVAQSSIKNPEKALETIKEIIGKKV